MLLNEVCYLFSKVIILFKIECDAFIFILYTHTYKATFYAVFHSNFTLTEFLTFRYLQVFHCKTKHFGTVCTAQPTLNSYRISLHKGPFKDCQHAKDAGYSNSGIYMIKPENSNEPMQLWCENSLDPGGWAVIQKRTDGSVNFFRNWDSYKVTSGMLKISTFILV